ncbi:MAG: hypothetical protein A2104_03330 [Candidatus Melainabacteria bacterium GWF2_32_7]|nr:MAG: hypothetical protein A2104_03330 [Candidatus Melainabacteria bacterium GWF2_32_7]
MPAIVNNINLDSIAEDLDIKPKDEIISINEIKPRDLIDYRYLTASEEVSLHIKRLNGEEEIIDIEKDADEDLGINFESAVFDKILPCNNKCIFCFVDQQPCGLRDSLYIKDDDYRLSFLQGTYVTLTNLTKEHKKRIEALRLGPLYISVHTTNPELRSYMLKNPKSGNIIAELKWLNDLEIPVHIQIVLCPGINDGQELDRTLSDLTALKSNILSIAVVPVGITKYRLDNNLHKVSPEKAEEIISQIYKFNKKLGYNLAFPADELYIMAKQDLPKLEFYNDFGQLDDGIGTCRLLLNDFEKNKAKLPASLPTLKKLTIATGKIACYALEPITDKLNSIKNLEVSLIPIKSHFWGSDVTVSGLVTGQDLLDNLLPIKSEVSNLVLPSVMLRKYTNDFLDSLTIDDIKDKIQAQVHIIDNYYSTEELVSLIIS